MTTLYLASASPRRRELLTQIGVAFVTRVQPIDETPLPAEAPAASVSYTHLTLPTTPYV